MLNKLNVSLWRSLVERMAVNINIMGSVYCRSDVMEVYPKTKHLKYKYNNTFIILILISILVYCCINTYI